jgi:hypothetical protein
MAKMTIDDLVAQLSAVYGNELVAITLYGSAARGEHISKRSDLNVLVVVERVTMDHLRKGSPIARAWREAGNPPPLTLTRGEWTGGADIFPIEYADILAYHKVLTGTLPLDGMRVNLADLRLQLEHEAMSMLLRLRHAVLESGTDSKAVREVLERSVSTMLVLYRALLRLLGEEPDADSEAVCERVRVRCGIDTQPTLRLVRQARGKQPLAQNEIIDVLQKYLEGSQALVAYLDRYTT